MPQLTTAEVEQYRRDIGLEGPVPAGETRSYEGPYPTVLSERNHWTYRQDTADIPEMPTEPVYDVPPVALDPTTQTHLASGGTGSVSVTKTGEGVSDTWTVDKQVEATWVTLVSPPNQVPQSAWPGAVNYTVAANTTGQPRQGFLYINGKTFTVNQGAL